MTETELVTKDVSDVKFGDRTFYGVRVYLKSPEELHADPEDDDRSAITLWVPWTRAGGHDFAPVGDALMNMLGRLHEAMGREMPSEYAESDVDDNRTVLKLKDALQKEFSFLMGVGVSATDESWLKASRGIARTMGLSR